MSLTKQGYNKSLQNAVKFKMLKLIRNYEGITKYSHLNF